MDQTTLYVSNYWKEIEVPLNCVSDVTENRWLNTHPVTIHFRDMTDFGSKITFIPTTRMFAFWSSHPIVEEIKQAANLAPRYGA